MTNTPHDAAMLLEQLRHACSVALGDLIALGMPAEASTSKLLLKALTAVGDSSVATLADNEDAPPKINYPPIKAGDRVYAVGSSGFNSRPDLQVYSAIVRSVYPEGSYGANAPAELLARTPLVITLHDDRPILGFPKWTYRDHEIGATIHRSKTDALYAHGARARQCRTEAIHACARANAELAWVLATMAACPEGNS